MNFKWWITRKNNFNNKFILKQIIINYLIIYDILWKCCEVIIKVLWTFLILNNRFKLENVTTWHLKYIVQILHT